MGETSLWREKTDLFKVGKVLETFHGHRMCCNRAGGGWLGENDYQSQKRKERSTGRGIDRLEIKIRIERGDETGNT